MVPTPVRTLALTPLLLTLRPAAPPIRAEGLVMRTPLEVMRSLGRRNFIHLPILLFVVSAGLFVFGDLVPQRLFVERIHDGFDLRENGLPAPIGEECPQSGCDAFDHVVLFWKVWQQSSASEYFFRWEIKGVSYRLT